MTKLHLAYYKGEGDYQDRLIRWATRSKYSHVELVYLNAAAYRTDHPVTAIGLSSSARDGGVREKKIIFTPEKWDFQRVSDWHDPTLVKAAKAHMFEKYDLKGLLFSQVFAFRRHSPNRWFCSEFCAYALGLENPHSFSPGSLFEAINSINWAFQDGRRYQLEQDAAKLPN